MTNLTLKKVTPHCGAELHGVDLANPTNSDMEAIRDAYHEYGVVFFRNQNLTPEDHIAFARRWGDIDINKFFPANGEYPEIAEVRKEKTQTTNIGGGWHTDHSYDQIPAMGSVLVARELPETGGDTLYASMYAAYDSLSDGLKKTLGSLRAVHSNVKAFGAAGLYKNSDQGGGFKGSDLVGEAVHPVVITHPLSGKKALYVNPGFTMHFEGWTEEESQPLLNFLYAHAARPEHTCRFVWQPGSVAFWDNRATWHFAVNDYHGHSRLMHRITIAGEALAA